MAISAAVTSGPRAGETVDLAHINNITLEDFGARVVGSATLARRRGRLRYQCLNGASLKAPVALSPPVGPARASYERVVASGSGFGTVVGKVVLMLVKCPAPTSPSSSPGY